MSTNCIKFTNKKIVPFKEQKSSFILNNQKSRDLEIHHVDGCVITNGIRCDWMVIDTESGKEIYIELKGTDLNHAFEQLKETIRKLTKDQKKIKSALIICTRSPMSSSEIQIMQKSIFQTHKAKLYVKTSEYRENIEKLIA
ncbi:hypothetical protein AAH450_20970 [Erwinia sp. P7711]|uniref:hypothetical protein n=1 Tax=Erwinia sp. P7711 TaxID=3141451 RepID=UPI00318FE601